jgi:hypothetical protein
MSTPQEPTNSAGRRPSDNGNGVPIANTPHNIPTTAKSTTESTTDRILSAAEIRNLVEIIVKLIGATACKLKMDYSNLVAQDGPDLGYLDTKYEIYAFFLFKWWTWDYLRNSKICALMNRQESVDIAIEISAHLKTLATTLLQHEYLGGLATGHLDPEEIEYLITTRLEQEQRSRCRCRGMWTHNKRAETDHWG